MATAPLSEEDELTCPICFELFVDPHTPKNLPICGHVCCEICLKKMMEGKCQRACPECRKVIKIDVGGITSFTTNYRLRSLAENHQKVGDNLQSNFRPLKSGVPLCADHDDEKMHFYCVTCNRLACQACLVLNHKGTEHSIEGIKEMCKKQKDEMKSVILRAKSRIDAAEDVLSECKAAENYNNELHDAVKVQVDEYIEMQINKLIEQGQAFKRQIESSKEFNDSWLKQQTSSAEKQISSFKISHQAAVNATENLPDYEYITQHALLVNKLEDIQIPKPTTPSTIKQKDDVIKFVPKQPHLKIGHIISVRTMNKIQTLDGFVSAISLDCSPDGLLVVNDHDSERVVTYHKVDGKYEKKLDLKLAQGKRYMPTDTAICPDGRYMVARHTCIEVYSPDGNHQNDIKIRDGRVKVNRVQVTSDGRILIGDFSASLIMEVSQTGEVRKTIHTSIKPMYITVIHNTHIAISDWEAGKVIVIDIESGQQTLSIDITRVQGICYDEQTDSLLTARSELADEPSNILLDTGVIDQYSYTTGKLIACLQQGLYYPTGIALTSEGHLIVANYKNVEIYDIQ